LLIGTISPKKGLAMKKRIALVVGTVGLLVFLVAGIAFAMVITGTNGPNNITATNNADNIAASANRDVVNGRGGPDRIFGDGGNDTLNGGAGSDHIESGDGSNVARGYDGNDDWVSVVDNDTNDFVSGGNGTGDVCVVDLVNGVTDEFSDTCEKVYQTAAIPQK
jgi:Ca2+-binding RTX toxin-like protein